MKTNSKPYDAIIIGAGPAGLVAAIYLARFKLNFIVIDDNKSRASLIPKSHNYPGFSHGISGNEILKRLQNQLKIYKVKILKQTVSKLTFDSRHNTFKVSRKVSSKISSSKSKHNTQTQHFRAKKIILATGLIDIEPNLPKVKNPIKKGLIRHCPICDAFEVSGKKIALLCHDKSNIDKAFFLSRYSKDITLFTLGQKIKFTKESMKKIISAKIRIIEDPIVEVLIKKDKITTLKTSKGTHNFDTLYSALGCILRSNLALQMGARHTKDGSLIVGKKQETSVAGLYAAGDVVDGLNQITVAMGQAAIAASALNDSLDQ